MLTRTRSLPKTRTPLAHSWKTPKSQETRTRTGTRTSWVCLSQSGRTVSPMNARPTFGTEAVQ